MGNTSVEILGFFDESLSPGIGRLAAVHAPAGTSSGAGVAISIPASAHALDIGHLGGVGELLVELLLLGVARATGSVIRRTTLLRTAFHGSGLGGPVGVSQLGVGSTGCAVGDAGVGVLCASSVVAIKRLISTLE